MIQSLTNILGNPAPFSYQVPGYKTGYPSLDDNLGGISTSDLVLLASKTGNWGSNLMLNLAIGLSRQYPVLLIHTMKKAPVVARELRSALLPDDSIPENDEQTLDELSHLAANIFIEDEASFLEEIDKSISAFKSLSGEDAIILIDQLNSIFLSKEIRSYSRGQEEREIAVNLKMLALKYHLPVLLLARIKSSKPANEKDPPAFRDLEHLLGLNCPFNKIIGVHRPEYYRIETDEKGSSTEDKLFLHILRNNSGIRGIVRLSINISNRFRLTDEIQNQFE
ncbi:MAG: DnaB-like helicase C-terminal domain-containing protein [Bacteroidales bacterium]